MARYWIANAKAGFRLTKAKCPSCGHRRLSRYYDRKTGELMDEEFGRCERVNNCGHDHDPNRILSGLSQDESYKPRPLPPPVERPTNYRIPIAAFDGTFRDHSGNLLMAFLRDRFGEQATGHALSEYCVGTYTGRMRHMHGSAFFWLINLDGEVVTGHAIKYGPDGKRDKSQTADNLWAHYAATGKTASELGVPEVWFGEHLLSAYPDKIIGVVESEKTAAICSIAYPGMLWLATGGESKLTRKKMRLLRGRDVVLYPDIGAAHQRWIELSDDLGAYFLTDGSLSVSDALLTICGPQDDGCDIADFILDGRADDLDILPEHLRADEEEASMEVIIEDGPPIVAEPALSTLIRSNPAIAGLVSALGLEPVHKLSTTHNHE